MLLQQIQVGRGGKFTARFNTAGKMGQQNKVLTVSSNNGSGNVELTIAGTVTEAAAAPMAATTPTAMEANATPVAKGKVKVKKADGTKDKVKMTDSKTEMKK